MLLVEVDGNKPIVHHARIHIGMSVSFYISTILLENIGSNNI